MRQVIIMFLIRRRFELKKLEEFQFVNQKSKTDYYYFSNQGVWKRSYTDDGEYIIGSTRPSRVSLNWLLDDRCQIIKKEV